MRNEFFADVRNLDELRKAYREAALKHHPDRGGDNETMRRVNEAYKEATAYLTSEKGWDTEAQHGKTWSQGRQNYYSDLSEKLRQKLYDLLSVEGVRIEITGYWFWVHHPDSRSIKDVLKAKGCRWHSKKKLWYYAGVKSRGRGKMSMNEIRDSYGSQVMQGNDENKAIEA